MEQQITYIRPDNGEWLRLTVGACAAVDLAKYRKYLREGRDWCANELGLDAADLSEETDAEVLTAVNAAYERAWMLASLKRVEVGVLVNGAQGAPGEPQNFIAGELPCEWRTPAGFAYALPFLLFETWRKMALAHNPGVFLTPLGDEEKKRGSVFVT